MNEFLTGLFPDLFTKLLPSDYLAATLVTVKITFFSTFLSYLFGIPLGVLLYGTAKDSVFPNKPVNAVIGFIVNIIRSVPFIICLVMIQPVAKLVVGSKLGDDAFAGCRSLKIAVLPPTLRSFGRRVFEKTTKLLVFPNSMAEAWARETSAKYERIM